MNHFYEIIGRDGSVIQRIAVLTRREKEQLAANGYEVREASLSTSLYKWLIEEQS